MQYKSFTEEDLNSVLDAGGYISRIKTIANALIENIVTLGGDPEIQNSTKSSMVYGEDGTILIRTPYGDGRITFDLLVDGKIQGRHTVEKQVRSSDGSLVWVPVWSMSTSERGVFLGNYEQPFTMNGPHVSGRIWEAYVSIIYAIATGPIRA
ncbi:hypothetical protein N5C93_17215 [Pseudomonas nitroreducens]|uniref:hypothetical protein n=1 Tax=Pseudomonas nitroreducens TaxID=46680 RepID=UPI00244D37EA|nr:hypothetical protein [Pseudomonas nitroreducens]MDH1074583.1 hypothetical protein [Pseudomonas nitroreducens]